MCEAGELGEIYYARAQAIRRRGVPTWGVFPNKALQGGGPLIDIGTHSLDLTLWMMNNYEPQSVMGASFEKLGRLLKPGEQGNGFSPWDNEDYQVEDSAFGFVTMKNGAVITIDASWALNTLDVGEAMTMLCGTKAGADMKDGLRINHIVYDKQTVTKPETATPQGVAFFEGASVMSCRRFRMQCLAGCCTGQGRAGSETRAGLCGDADTGCHLRERAYRQSRLFRLMPKERSGEPANKTRVPEHIL